MDEGLTEADWARLRLRNEKLTGILSVATAMTAERKLDALLDLIMRESVRIVDAERCTLFLVDKEKKELWSKIAHGLEARTLRIRINSGVGAGIAGHVAVTGLPLNIEDPYRDPRFNPAFDRQTGFKTESILCVPMIGTQGQTVGVMQALNHHGGPFTAEDAELLMALGGNAAAAIENASLYEDIEKLLDGFVEASVTAIEARDPITSGHSGRVAEFSVTLLEQLPREPAYASLEVTPDLTRELRYAALLHDFGKVGVREHVLVKADKLYPNQLELLEKRFELALMSSELDFLRARVAALEAGEKNTAALELAFRDRQNKLRDILEFVLRCNRPTVLAEGGLGRLQELLSETYRDAQQNERPLFSALELENLSIARGSLNHAERLEIESHVTHTYNFLRRIPWTPDLARIPEIAYGHHEKLDGTGYPRRVGEPAIPVQTRIMTIADIYDALTASDRPYKAAVPHEKALDILGSEAKSGKVDPALLAIFIASRVAERVLRPLEKTRLF